MDSYNELEYMVLAMVGDGVNSGYAMRRRMQTMRGGRWSPESGSVYRVLRRLQGNQLVNQLRKVGVPNRERTEYELTPAGEVLVSKWLTDLPGQEEFEGLMDSLRTRVYFLNRLDPKRRLQTVKSWMVHNKRMIDHLKESGPRAKTPPEIWVHESMLCLAKARQDWLRSMYAQIKQDGVSAKPPVKRGGAKAAAAP